MSYNIYSFFYYNNINFLMKGWFLIKKLMYLLILGIIITPIYIIQKASNTNLEKDDTNIKQETSNLGNGNRNSTENVASEVEPIFSYSPIPDSIKNKMLGLSIPKSQPISFDSLSYLRLTYYGFDENTHVGEMIVNKDIAPDVVDSFKEVYYKKYPIEKIKLIDEYNADDELSMADNNTSSFAYRTIKGTNVISNHGKGLAIDINPLQNPHVVGNTASPKEGETYIDRSNVRKGIIIEGDDLYNAFVSRGFSWGGHWKNPDYQHFERKL